MHSPPPAGGARQRASQFSHAGTAAPARGLAAVVTAVRLESKKMVRSRESTAGSGKVGIAQTPVRGSVRVAAGRACWQEAPRLHDIVARTVRLAA